MTAVLSTNRRVLLTALLALPALGHASQASPHKERDQLTGLFSNRQSAAILGQAYLQQQPEEADRQKLENLLLSPGNLQVLAPEDGNLDQVGTRNLKAAFQTLRRRDFDEGNVRQIGGCMLSVTELRLCALVALS